MSLTPVAEEGGVHSVESSPQSIVSSSTISTHSHHHRSLLKQSRTTVPPTLPRTTSHVLFRTPSFQKVSQSLLTQPGCKEFMAAGNIAWKKFEDGFPNLMIGMNAYKATRHPKTISWPVIYFFPRPHSSSTFCDSFALFSVQKMWKTFADVTWCFWPIS
jgi:hypothetical protein